MPRSYFQTSSLTRGLCYKTKKKLNTAVKSFPVQASDLENKYKTRPKKLVRDEHSSFLVLSVFDEEKVIKH
jgi:hypothetical protein